MTFSDSFLHWMSIAFSKLSLALVVLKQDLIYRQKQYLKHFKIFTGLLGLLRNDIKYRLAAVVKLKKHEFQFSPQVFIVSFGPGRGRESSAEANHVFKS